MLRSARFALLLLLFLCAVAGGDPLMRPGLDEARGAFPPEVTRALLQGATPAPDGFDARMTERIGRERLAVLRSGGAEVEGKENDEAALCLVALGVSPASVSGSDRAPARPRGEPHEGTTFSVARVASTYPVASGKTSGSFRAGQDADLMLSGLGFGEAGGPLLFNHPMGIASDGRRLLLADTYNNRVLIWSALPDGNTPPDLVLGQQDFSANDSGDGRDRLNWPVQVATDGTRVLVADTENHRILIWNRFPERNGAPADLVLNGEAGAGVGIGVNRSRFHWPWGLWTDGRRMAITSTRGGGVLIWNEFPTRDDQPADLVLRGGGDLGTPRTITSDGARLIVGDHNPRNVGARAAGTFFWKAFPTRDDAPYDFFRPDDFWLRGTVAPGGRWVLLGATLHVWNAFPADANDDPDLSIRGFKFSGGDHTGVACAAGRLYLCLGNRNLVAVYRSIPDRADARPDFAIGSPDFDTNTLETNFIISNPVPASNGKSLFVASDFDRKLYVWKGRPDASGAHPDLVCTVGQGLFDLDAHGEVLVSAGQKTVNFWEKPPLDGEPPSRRFTGGIGGVRFQELRGIAYDGRRLYLSDLKAGKLHVWNGLPAVDDAPAFSLDVADPWRVKSDGKYVCVGSLEGHQVTIYRVAEMKAGAAPAATLQGPARGERFNQPLAAVVGNGRLFVADAAWSRVHVWNDIEAAIAGGPADALLGAEDLSDQRPEQGRAKLHYPASVCWDGAYLWVGETKFSERLLRFSPK